MLNSSAGKCAAISVSLFLCVGIAFAVVVHDTVEYERPVSAIRGRVTGFGQVVPILMVDVYNNAQVWLDNSLAPVEKRKRQTKVASVQPNTNGEFNVARLRKGFYEVEFGNRANGGYNILSVLVNVDPKGTKDSLCVDLSLEGGGGQSKVNKCGAK